MPETDQGKRAIFLLFLVLLGVVIWTGLDYLKDWRRNRKAESKSTWMQEEEEALMHRLQMDAAGRQADVAREDPAPEEKIERLRILLSEMKSEAADLNGEELEQAGLAEFLQCVEKITPALLPAEEAVRGPDVGK